MLTPHDLSLVTIWPESMSLDEGGTTGMRLSESDAHQMRAGLAPTRLADTNPRDAALVAACDMIPLMMGIAELHDQEQDVILIHSNAAVASYLDRTSAELEGSRISQIGVAPILRRIWVAKMRSCIASGKPISFEYEHQSPQDPAEKRWSKATVWPLPVLGDSGNARFVYMVENITPYRVTEAALIESRRFLERVAQATPNIWYVYDLKEHRTVYANREIAVVLGFSAEEVHQMGPDVLATLLPPDDLQSTAERFAKHPFRLDNEVTESEFRIRRKGGTYRWLLCHEVPFLRDEETGLVQQMLGVAQDITARRETQDELVRSEFQLRLAMEGADIGAFVIDCATEIIRLSPYARRHLGLPSTQETIPLSAMNQVVYKEDFPAFNAALRKTLTEHVSLDVEYRALQQDGTLRWNNTKAQLTFDPVTNAPMVLVGVCFDIQERKQAEEEKAAAAQQQKRIAATLQSSLLSVASADGPLSHDNIAGTNITISDYGDSTFPSWQVATLYEAALDEAKVGGDFYDVFTLKGNKTAFVVGDVSGKGLDAAVSIAEVKFGLRSFLRGINDDPAAALRFLNERQMDAQNMDGRSRERLIALMIAVADNDTGVVRLACAGMEPPIHCQETGSASAVEEICGLPLGTLPDCDYMVRVITLAAGESLLLYTDGLTEVRDPQMRQLLGTEGLKQIIEAAMQGNTTPPTLCRQIMEGVSLFAKDKSRRDDVCLLAAMKR